MKTKVLNYQVIVTPDEYPDGSGRGYSANCPTLGVADDGATIEEALSNVKGAIEAYIESLVDDGQVVPVDPEQAIMTSVNISTHNFGDRPTCAQRTTS